jgi:hypothetical protein
MRSLHEPKNSALLTKTLKTCHSERSEESMQLIDVTGFLATLRMTR